MYRQIWPSNSHQKVKQIIDSKQRELFSVPVNSFNIIQYRIVNEFDSA